MISGSSYSRSVAAARCDHKTGNRCASSSPIFPRPGTCCHPQIFDFYRIGSCNSLVLRVSGIWQFAFPTFVVSNNCAGGPFQAGWDLTGGNECLKLGRFIFHSYLFSSQA